MKKITIATRESLLAMWQAKFIKSELEKAHPGLEVELLGMTTRGDQILDKALSKVGGKGLFIKELEWALLEKRADIAVHSMKDVPMELEDEFELAMTSKRHDPRDAFVSNNHASLDELKEGQVVGTSSLRRESQLARRYPHLKIEPLRGNVQTRLRKLDEGMYDAIILASAGLERLELADRIRMKLPVESFLPAAGQAALGVEILKGREDLRELLAPLNDPQTEKIVKAEREFSRIFGGSCQIPIACHGEARDGGMWLRAMVATPGGDEMIEGEISGSLDTPIENAGALADKMGRKEVEALVAKVVAMASQS